MRVEILTRIGFDPKHSTPGTVLAAPGDVPSEMAADWIKRGLAREVLPPTKEPDEPPPSPTKAPKESKNRSF